MNDLNWHHIKTSYKLLKHGKCLLRMLQPNISNLQHILAKHEREAHDLLFRATPSQLQIIYRESMYRAAIFTFLTQFQYMTVQQVRHSVLHIYKHNLPSISTALLQQLMHLDGQDGKFELYWQALHLPQEKLITEMHDVWRNDNKQHVWHALRDAQMNTIMHVASVVVFQWYLLNEQDAIALLHVQNSQHCTPLTMQCNRSADDNTYISGTHVWRVIYQTLGNVLVNTQEQSTIAHYMAKRLSHYGNYGGIIYSMDHWLQKDVHGIAALFYAMQKQWSFEMKQMQRLTSWHVLIANNMSIISTICQYYGDIIFVMNCIQAASTMQLPCTYYHGNVQSPLVSLCRNMHLQYDGLLSCLQALKMVAASMCCPFEKGSATIAIGMLQQRGLYRDQILALFQ